MVRRQPVNDSLCLHLDGLVDELARQVPAALHQFDVNAIHKSRVATRRLKAAMDLLRPVLVDGQRKPFVRVTRNLRRRLGPLRDLDVMLLHLDQPRGKKHADAVTWVRQRLLEQRESARTDAAGHRDGARVIGKLGAWWALRDNVTGAEAAAPALLAESLHLQLDAFCERADRMCREADDSDDSSEPRDPHQLRIAGKRLRYTLELAAAQGHPLNPILFKLFKKMQDALGLWHDFVVLTEAIMRLALEHELHLHDPRMYSKLLDLSRYSLTRARRELEKFAQLWSDSGELISGAIREAFGLSEPQTGRGPSGSDEPAAPEAPDQGAAPAA